MPQQTQAHLRGAVYTFGLRLPFPMERTSFQLGCTSTFRLPHLVHRNRRDRKCGRRVIAVARRYKDGPQTRRLLSLAAIYEGATRTQAAAISSVTLQVIRDWVVKFNAFGPEGMLDRKAPEQPSRLNDAQRKATHHDHRERTDPRRAWRRALPEGTRQLLRRIGGDQLLCAVPAWPALCRNAPKAIRERWHWPGS